MKWILMLAIFVGGIFYLVNQRKQEVINAEKERLAMTEQIKTEEPVLPASQEKSTALKFSAQTIQTLRALTSDSNEKVRVASAELLWQLQDEEAANIIKNMFSTETEGATKQQLIEIIQRDKNRASLALLMEALKDYDKETRIKAVEAIGSYSTKEAIPALDHALKDYDEEVRFKALQAVDKIRKDIEALKKQQLEELKAKKEKLPAVKLD
ncbi:MAG TPA: hypothetical protein DCZ92_04230 [Elusimicrobia bacterium]|nr:MAG: hypothetical protein A2016_07850 [Elusimicrobia bacterium GWF2_62_30]HBA60023.1 hypothetical protein [Elusimicrobiota bacterium]